MIRAKILIGLQWATLVVASICSIDAILALYKTIQFRQGIKSASDFYAVLAICLAVLAVTLLAGTGALTGLLKTKIVFPSFAILGLSVVLGLGLLLGQALALTEWISLAVSSKSESVFACVVLSCLLLLVGGMPATGAHQKVENDNA